MVGPLIAAPHLDRDLRNKGIVDEWLNTLVSFVWPVNAGREGLVSGEQKLG